MQFMRLQRLYYSPQNLRGVRLFCCSQSLEGRRATATVRWLKRTEHPYDSRFPLSPKDIGKSGHSGEIKRLLSEIGTSGYMMPQPPGIYDRKGHFHFVPEMVPEFVVPDLTDCKLKPYVSYKVSEITQSEMTASDLFDSTYGKDIVEKFKKGKLNVDELTADDILLSYKNS